MEYDAVLAATCTAGSYCGQGVSGVGTTPQSCGYGKMCPTANINMEEIPCDAGYYNGGTGAVSCSPCDAGSYCPYMWDVSGNGNTQLTDCPAGHECTTSLLHAPTPCPAGKFQATSTNDGTTCADCTAGFYCPFEATITPVACPDLMLCALGSSAPAECVDG